MSTSQLSICVVGGGICGLSAAEWLRRDGHQVTIFDPEVAGSRTQASYGNGGILARAAVVPVSVPGLMRNVPKMLLDKDGPLFLRWGYLPRLFPWLLPFIRAGEPKRVEKIAEALSHILSDSVDQHDALSAGGKAASYINKGEYAYLYKDRAGFEGDAFGFNLRAKHGFDWREVGREELRAMDSHLSEEIGFGVMLQDHAWIADPGGYLAALIDAFLQGGGKRISLPVDRVEGHPERPAVYAGGERHSFDRIVIAAGIWSRKLAEALGHSIPMESERGYHLSLRGVSHKPPVPYMLADAKFVVTPMNEGIRCAGLVEFGGTQAPAATKPIDLLRRRIARLYPSLEWEEEDSWLGHRPSPVDSLPFIGESSLAPNVYFGFGTHHVGLTSGPKIGRMIADMIAGRHPNMDISPYRTDRFDKAHSAKP